MAGDDEVSVRFGAQTDEFNSGVDELKDKLSEVGDAAEPLGGIFEDLAGKLAAAFAVDKIASFVSSSNEAANNLYILSQRTGIAASTFSALNIPLLQSGSSVDDLAASMRFLQRNLGEAA